MNTRWHVRSLTTRLSVVYTVCVCDTCAHRRVCDTCTYSPPLSCSVRILQNRKRTTPRERVFLALAYSTSYLDDLEQSTRNLALSHLINSEPVLAYSRYLDVETTHPKRYVLVGERSNFACPRPSSRVGEYYLQNCEHLSNRSNK